MTVDVDTALEDFNTGYFIGELLFHQFHSTEDEYDSAWDFVEDNSGVGHDALLVLDALYQALTACPDHMNPRVSDVIQGFRDGFRTYQ